MRSIQSDAVSRKSRYRAKAVSLLKGQQQSSVSSVIPTGVKLGDNSKQPVPVTTPPEPTKQFLRPKNLFQGVYFPCFGYILTGGVLAGTEIFPFSPKQEKLHFMHATMSPLDHLDGQENCAYLDSILIHMQIKMESWETSSKPDFLCETSWTYHEVKNLLS